MSVSIRRVSVRILVPALALVVSACSTGSSPSASVGAPSEAPQGSAGAPSEAPSAGGLTETTPVTIYVGGVTSSAPQAFAAKAEGIFDKYKLQPEFVVLDGTSQAVQAVAAHNGGPAYTDGSLLDEMLIKANSPDSPGLISIAAMAPKNPVALVYLDGTGISKPADLVGKRIGVPTGSLSETYLKAFLAKEGISEDQVTIQNIGFSALHPALLQGQVDAVAEFARGIASMTVVAAGEGKKVGSFLFGDYDIPSPLTTVVVQQKLVDEKPEVARAIAAATTEALQFCTVNPEQCVKDFVAQNEGRDYDQTLAEWKLALEAQYGLDAATVKNLNPLQIGWFDEALVAKTVPELKAAFGITADIDPKSLYTNEFVEQP